MNSHMKRDKYQISNGFISKLTAKTYDPITLNARYVALKQATNKR